jgi:hypothetical protein
MKMFQEQRGLKTILKNIPLIKVARVDVVGETPGIGSRSYTQFLVKNYKPSLCALQ